MTKEETVEALMVVQAAYPNYKPQNKAVTIDLWHAMLGGYDYQTVIVAVQAYIATDTSGFAPSIGQVIGKIKEISKPARMTGMEAWGLVWKAIKNSGWETKKQFDQLPPDIQRAVGSASQLHAWATDKHFNESVVMSQFIRAYDEIVRRREAREALPAAARKMIDTEVTGDV